MRSAATSANWSLSEEKRTSRTSLFCGCGVGEREKARCWMTSIGPYATNPTQIRHAFYSNNVDSAQVTVTRR
jgi:hypothetical protein